MAFTNLESKEIHCKLVYIGPEGSGKSENLKSVYKSTSYEIKQNLAEFVPSDQRTKVFDFLPLSLGTTEGYHIKFHLFSFPLQMNFSALPSFLWRGVDGFVFVADSRVSAIDENLASLGRLRSLLREHGYQVETMPKVLQYNKRDLPDVFTMERLRLQLNPDDWPEVEAAAPSQVGTMETLIHLGRQVIYKLAPP